MSELDVLRQLEGRLLPPAYGDLAAVARSRRRRSAVVAAAATVAAVLVAVGVGAALSGDERSQGPIDRPSPTGSPSAQAWIPDQVREKGLVGDVMPPIASGLQARQYVACDGGSCDGPPADRHAALEVSQGAQSAVFDLYWEASPWFKPFDDHSVLVLDHDAGGPARYRLLHADGTATELRLLDDLAPAAAAPGIVAIPSSTVMDGTDRLYLLDDSAGTLQLLDVPDEVRSWPSNVREFLWGVTDDCRIFWSTAKSHAFRRLGCSDKLDFTTLPATYEIPTGWLRPGRMVVKEQFDPGNQTAIHVSLDSGATWQRFVIAGNDSIDSVLRSIGP